MKDRNNGRIFLFFKKEGMTVHDDGSMSFSIVIIILNYTAISKSKNGWQRKLLSHVTSPQLLTQSKKYKQTGLLRFIFCFLPFNAFLFIFSIALNVNAQADDKAAVKKVVETFF